MTGIEITAFLRPELCPAGDGGRSKYPRVNFACYNNFIIVLACENIEGAMQPPAIPRWRLCPTRAPLATSRIYPVLRASNVVA
jgi:hypothetical protein